MRNVCQRLVCLETWFPGGGTVGKCYGAFKRYRHAGGSEWLVGRALSHILFSFSASGVGMIITQLPAPAFMLSLPSWL